MTCPYGFCRNAAPYWKTAPRMTSTYDLHVWLSVWPAYGSISKKIIPLSAYDLYVWALRMTFTYDPSKQSRKRPPEQAYQTMKWRAGAGVGQPMDFRGLGSSWEILHRGEGSKSPTDNTCTSSLELPIVSELTMYMYTALVRILRELLPCGPIHADAQETSAVYIIFSTLCVLMRTQTLGSESNIKTNLRVWPPCMTFVHELRVWAPRMTFVYASAYDPRMAHQNNFFYIKYCNMHNICNSLH